MFNSTDKGGTNLTNLILASLIHVLFCTLIIWLCLQDKINDMRKLLFITLISWIIGILPDVMSYLGSSFGHTLWFIPVVGIIGISLTRIWIRDISNLRLWVAYSLALTFGHIFIDFAGNGVPFLFPLTQEEYSLNIIERLDYFILIILLFMVGIRFVYKKWKVISLIGIIFIGLYIGGLTVSKNQLEEILNERYKDDGINLLLIFRSSSLSKWKFMVRTDNVWVNGYSPILNQEIYIESEKEVYK